MAAIPRDQMREIWAERTAIMQADGAVAEQHADRIAVLELMIQYGRWAETYVMGLSTKRLEELRQWIASMPQNELSDKTLASIERALSAKDKRSATVQKLAALPGITVGSQFQTSGAVR